MEKMADRVAILVGGRLLAVEALRDRGGGTRFRLRIGGDPERVARCLAAVPGVRSLDTVPAGGVGRDRGPAEAHDAKRGAGAYVVDVDATTPADRVAAAVVGAGLALAELREEPVDLEALFLQLTGTPPTPPREPDGPAMRP
jgi:hypothetical protein